MPRSTCRAVMVTPGRTAAAGVEDAAGQGRRRLRRRGGGRTPRHIKNQDKRLTNSHENAPIPMVPPAVAEHGKHGAVTVSSGYRT